MDSDFFLAGILRDLLGKGFELPIHCAVMGVNGSVSATLIEKVAGEDRLSSTRTIEHVVDERFDLPVNVFFVDSRGEAVRVLVKKDGNLQWMN